MNIILFGITGLGNSVLEELIDLDLKPKKIITRKEIGPDPYLGTINIEEIAKKNNIPVEFNATYVKEKYDLCIVATYHKLINLKRSNFYNGFNIHPSLLPDLKGRDPISEAIKKNYEYTGVTLHELTEKFDEGKIIFQQKIKIKTKSKKEILKIMIPVYKKFTREIINKLI